MKIYKIINREMFEPYDSFEVLHKNTLQDHKSVITDGQ